MKEEMILRKILRIVPEAKVGLSISLGVGLVYEIIKFIPVILIKLIVDYLVAGQTGVVTLGYLAAGILAAYLAMTGIDHFAKRQQFIWMHTYEAKILRRAKEKLLALHMGFHESYNTGEQVAKITKGAHKLSDLIWFSFNEFIPTLIQLVLTVGILLTEQWILAVIFILFLPPTIWISVYTSKVIQPIRKEYHQNYDDAIGELGESLLNISTVKDYVQEKKQFAKYEKLLNLYLKNATKRTYLSRGILFWRDLLLSIGRFVTLGVAVFMVTQEMITAGSLVLVYSLTERAFLSTFRIGRLYFYLEDAMESINRLAALLDTRPRMIDAEKPKFVKNLKGNIVFDNVTFAYDNEKPVLRDINLVVEPRKVIALVGKSGSGKTTLIKLLLRNYDVRKGSLIVDGHDIRTYARGSYKKRIGVVSQHVEVFNRTVLENIRFARPKASREEVIVAAKKAHAHEFITQFANGYDTVVGEKGVRLSGGQKQRLSIARALLSDPDVFVFDEATSSLDSESERFIQQSIFEIAGKKTTIIIAHRLSTIQHADVIVVMDSGRIVEQGSYKELARKKGAFARMLELQKIGEIRN